MEGAFQYIIKYKINTEAFYPYAGVTQACKTPAGGFFNLSSYYFIPEVKDCSIMTQNVKNRPVTIAVDSSNWALYKSGIFSNCV